uniref:uncharacterized protein K02A2.6-like n=1 Tax=Styela clava TaxID=7725 RepID=UPI00193A2AC8|nr:uncharacterized protein K02A2.6-like [Styela clava]
MVVQSSCPIALTPHEIEQASAKDPELQIVRDCIKSQNWSKCGNSFLHVKNELCIHGQLILRGTRIVIPQILRKRVLELAHEGHQGIVKTKNRLRSKVWWPNIDRDAERKCKVCHGCQVTSSYSPPERMTRTRPPSGPWIDCCADVLGPLPSGDNILVIVDYYSRFYEIVIVRSTTSKKIIEALSTIFSRYGIPLTLRTDNAPQLVSNEFKSFLDEHGVQHKSTTPLWPQANGEVERQNRSLMKAIRIAQVEGKDWKSELNKFLLAYRSTPHTTTGVSPYYLMFGREMRTKLPEIRPKYNIIGEEHRDRDWRNKLQGKFYSDYNRRSILQYVEVGDSVLVKQEKVDKMSTNFNKYPCEIVKKEGGEVTVRDEKGKEFRRNSTFVKKYEEGTQNKIDNNAKESQIAPDATRPSSEESITQPYERPRRERKLPSRFQDFVMK